MAATPKLKLTTNVGGYTVAKTPPHGIMIETIHWEHYAERVEDIDMPNLDEGNFLSGMAGVFLSTVVALVGFAFGTEETSAWVYIVIGALLFGSGVLTLYFLRRYTRAKKTMKKTGAIVARHMRDVATDQKERAGLV